MQADTEETHMIHSNADAVSKDILDYTVYDSTGRIYIVGQKVYTKGDTLGRC